MDNETGQAPNAEQVTTPPAQTPDPAPTEDFHTQELPAEQASFDRAYVEKLRGEAAKYRTQARDGQPYREALARFTESDRAVWLNLVNATYADPKAGAAMMREIATNLAGGMTQDEAVDAAVDKAKEQTPTPALSAPPEPAVTPLSEADVARMFDERMNMRETQAEQARAVRAVEDAVVALGYEKGSTGFINVLHYAANQTGGDLDAAHKIVQGDRQAIIDGYLADKAAEGGTRVPHASGMTPSNEVTVKNMADAERAMRARLSGIFGGRS